MIQRLAVTAFPVVFLGVLFGSGALLRRRNIDMDGEPPIDRRLFYASKYLIVLVWAATVGRAWGASLGLPETPGAIAWIALGVWAAGFLLLFIGRLGLADSFRIGSPTERTSLRVDGLFAVSRNPMYVGVYATLLASTLYTLNPAVLLIAAFVVAVHHRIVLAEEQYLLRAFGDEYAHYRRRVRRYV